MLPVRGGQDLSLPLHILRLFSAIPVIHHAVRRANHSFLIGNTVKDQRHEGRWVLLQTPRYSPKQEQTVDRIKISISVVPRRRPKHPAFSRFVGPEGFASSIVTFQDILERCPDIVLSGCNRSDDLDLVGPEKTPI